MTQAQHFILRSVYIHGGDRGISASDLSHKILVKSQSIGTVMRNLGNRGLLEPLPQKQWKLTERGRHILIVAEVMVRNGARVRSSETTTYRNHVGINPAGWDDDGYDDDYW